MENHIAALRKQRRLSQEELAQAVGVSRQTITSLEVGKYTVATARVQAGALFWMLD